MKLTPEQLDALVGEVGFCIDGASFESALEQSQRGIDSAPDVAHLLTEEARLTNKLFRFATQAMHYGDFVRGSRGGIRLIASSITATTSLMVSGLPQPGFWGFRMA